MADNAHAAIKAVGALDLVYPFNLLAPSACICKLAARSSVAAECHKVAQAELNKFAHQKLATFPKSSDVLAKLLSAYTAARQRAGRRDLREAAPLGDGALSTASSTAGKRSQLCAEMDLLFEVNRLPAPCRYDVDRDLAFRVSDFPRLISLVLSAIVGMHPGPKTSGGLNPNRRIPTLRNVCKRAIFAPSLISTGRVASPFRLIAG